MDFSKYLFEHSNFVYFRVQLAIWSSNSLINPFTVQKSSVELISNIYREHQISKPLVLNCVRITEINERVFDNFILKDINEIKRPIIFINYSKISKRLSEIFDAHHIESEGATESLIVPPFEKIINKNYFLIKPTDSTYNTPDNLLEQITNFEEQILVNIVKESYDHFGDTPKRLHSTSVLATGEFDTTKIISSPKYFTFISLLLADKLIDFRDSVTSREGQYSNFKLLSVSLRSSPFASSVALLTNTSYDTIDHLGPKQKLWDIEMLDRFEKSVKYIYIGDFLVGGTETKIAQTYARLYECELEDVFVIGSFLPNEAFNNCINLHYLIRLNDDRLGYKINFTLL